MVCERVINTQSASDQGSVYVHARVHHSFHLDYTEPPITRTAANKVHLILASMSSYDHQCFLTPGQRPFSEDSSTCANLFVILISSTWNGIWVCDTVKPTSSFYCCIDPDLRCFHSDSTQITFCHPYNAMLVFLLKIFAGHCMALFKE